MYNISKRTLGQFATSKDIVSALTDSSYPKLNAWLKHLYWEVPGFKETTNFEHIKGHYMTSHPFVRGPCDLPNYRSTLTGSFVPGHCRTFSNLRVTGDDGLYLETRDVLTATPDGVLEPIDEVEVAVGVPAEGVAGMEPAVAPRSK